MEKIASREIIVKEVRLKLLIKCIILKLNLISIHLASLLLFCILTITNFVINWLGIERKYTVISLSKNIMNIKKK